MYDVGLGYTNAMQPVITTATSPLVSGSPIVLTGLKFKGISGGSDGTTRDSSSNYPVVQLRALGNDQVRYPSVSPTVGWTTTSDQTIPIAGFPPGLALVTVFTNGIPSTASIIRVE